MQSSALRHAARRLVRAPAFALAAALTLALGIAGTTAVFTVVNGVLFRPPPYRDAEQLVDFAHTLAIGGGMHVDQSDATYLFYRRANHVFVDVGAYRTAAVNLGGDGAAPERIDAAVTTPSVFRLLQVAPLRGRTLTQRDGEPGAAPGAAPVAVLNEGLWRRMFGGDPSVLGRPVDRRR
ncbi:MAG TPA: ABC transporter permease [Gemmatimonadaceae bacterium]